MRRLSNLVLLAITLLLLGVLACSDDDNDITDTPVAGAQTAVATIVPGQGGGETDSTVQVTERDFSISPDQNSVPSGEVSFNIRNEGPATHEFVVFKTDVPEGQLPIRNGIVDEEANSVEDVDEVEGISPGESKELKVDLQPGQYVLICNISGHYQLGMHAALEVR
jgi:uncharacterized cupredoxin-like copper-binding protein